ncbi:MAG: helix-turn-helix domain-containing protein [Gammaproteobacteria bacterium]
MKLQMNSPDGGTLPGNPKSKPPYNNALASQRARIIKHFANNPCLSTMQARNDLGILHPSGRVQELREDGYLIDTHWTTEEDSNGVLHRVGLYVFKGRQQMDGGDHAHH